MKRLSNKMALIQAVAEIADQMTGIAMIQVNAHGENSIVIGEQMLI